MLTPKENYLTILRGELPEWIPAFYEPYMVMLEKDPGFGTPIMAPAGPLYSPWGVKFVGSGPENNYGAIPEPGNFILKDIRRWRDVIHNPDLSHVDWERMLTKKLAGTDPAQLLVCASGADYFQTLVSFMGFEEALIAMYEEPEEVYALLDYVSQHCLEVMKQEIRWCHLASYGIADDCAAARAPFFSLEMYRALIKPFHKKHAVLALENGIVLEKHDCGRCEQFIDDWLDMGICSWNPAQVTNDLKAIKRNYLHRLTLNGCWDNQGPISMPETPDEALLAALRDYVDTFAPGGGFTFCAAVGGDKDDPRVQRKQALVKQFYYDEVKDYYHAH